MIYGIGNDIIEIERIEKAISKDGFKRKVYTDLELENLSKKGNRAESFAGIFSAKEAISKALGTGVRDFSLLDIEILSDDLGKPYVKVTKKLDELIKKKLNIRNEIIDEVAFQNFEINSKLKKYYEIQVSISHSKMYATAVAIILKI